MGQRVLCFVLPALLLTLCVAPGQVQPPDKPAQDPLPSWNAGAAKKAILDFVRTTTDKNSPGFVPPAERIATFDNDGTLWVEQPLYTQVVFALDRVKALSPQHADWKTQEPFKAILSGDREAMSRFTKKDLLEVLAATHSGMTTEQFHTIAREWLATAKHPRFQQRYTDCVYQPMLEVMKYLRANGFKTYIVTGGGQSFVRVFSEASYGIPVEQVIGSTLKLKYVKKGDRPVLLRLAALLLLDDEEGKPEDIELFIGRKPLAAFGNSNGDRQMLEWTQSGAGPRLMMLVHHDDAQREYAYGTNSKIGTFSASLMAEAKTQGWVVISMKNDWRRIFSFEGKEARLPAALVGKWVVRGGEQDGATFDFYRNGTTVGRINVQGKEGIVKARVRVEGKNIYSTTTNPRTGQDEARILVVRTLTARTLVIQDENGKSLKLERAE